MAQLIRVAATKSRDRSLILESKQWKERTDSQPPHKMFSDLCTCVEINGKKFNDSIRT